MSKDHLHPDGRPYTQEEFINKIKTDDKFAKQWGDLGPMCMVSNGEVVVHES
jgi:hypothetical protein